MIGKTLGSYEIRDRLGQGVDRFFNEAGAVLDPGLHVDAGIEVLVHGGYALGAMFIADFGGNVENTVASGGVTLTGY